MKVLDANIGVVTKDELNEIVRQFNACSQSRELTSRLFYKRVLSGEYKLYLARQDKLNCEVFNKTLVQGTLEVLYATVTAMLTMLEFNSLGGK